MVDIYLVTSSLVLLGLGGSKEYFAIDEFNQVKVKSMGIHRPECPSSTISYHS